MTDNKKPVSEESYQIVGAKDYTAQAQRPLSPAAVAPDVALERAPAKKATRPKRAVWIVHGMGQQVPFETLDSLTSGVRNAAPRPTSTPRLRSVKFGDQVVERVELDVHGQSGAEYELHLYEAYWAPVTEGVAKLSDVISFLFDGGLRGMLNALRPFNRAMFGGMQPFKIHKRTAVWILWTLLVVLALIAINAFIVAAGASSSKIPLFGGLAIGQQWEALTALASGMCSVALTFGAILFLSEMSKPANLNNMWKTVICYGGWIGFVCTTLAIIATAGLMLGDIKFEWVQTLLKDMPRKEVQGISTLLILTTALVVGLAMAYRGFLRSSAQPLRGNGVLVFFFAISFVLHLFCILGPLLASLSVLSLPEWLSGIVACLSNPIWVWPFLIALGKNVRTLLVQYVGDVAIYITANKLDRFETTRQKIKTIALTSASGIYQAKNDSNTDFEYEKVALVGHSLGSVIAYDTLNKLLVDDQLAGYQNQIENRTCLLETFGSPLDKIAFFFTIQGKDSFHIREQLASLVQPLIQSYSAYRKFPWINVYSKNDIVSGDLFLFDIPGKAIPPAINNLVDDQAVVPLAAHVDYWKNKLVWEQLYNTVAP